MIEVLSTVLSELSDGFLGFFQRTPWEVIHDGLDIGLVAVLIYWALVILRGTRAMQVAIGLCLVFVGYLDDAKGPIHQLVNEWKVALPLHAEYGTGPNIFYVPPISSAPLKEDGTPDDKNPRIPNEYLEELFGPNVQQALATIRKEAGSPESSRSMNMRSEEHTSELQSH